MRLQGFFSSVLKLHRYTPVQQEIVQRCAPLGLVALGLMLFAFKATPLSQPQHYHAFAEQRMLWGIPHAGDVLSNLAFLLVGLWGLATIFRPAVQAMFRSTRQAYGLMFVGIILTAFGSAYYHWAPDDATLIWDRLPMTLVFMPLLAATLDERIAPRLLPPPRTAPAVNCGSGNENHVIVSKVARAVANQRGRNLMLLVGLCALGLGSVGYWAFSGNLLPYLVAQVGSIVLVVFAYFLLPTCWSGRFWLFAALGCYGVAVCCEHFDHTIFHALGATVSGHTFKHLFAALAFYNIVWMLRQQRDMRR